MSYHQMTKQTREVAFESPDYERTQTPFFGPPEHKKTRNLQPVRKGNEETRQRSPFQQDESTEFHVSSNAFRESTVHLCKGREHGRVPHSNTAGFRVWYLIVPARQIGATGPGLNGHRLWAPGCQSMT